ncbi:hypothetical protein [Aggregatibacter actinomycetemcomitans]|uniref:hypothetical protein n=1 Tax=Aggregatibacter actinomycetemcomitans TaxID=714 RepID=UPI001E589747|nr:hypothetical protein [Aggregatibacter actinomycetemcomitans]
MARKIIQICESSMCSDSFGDSWNLSALCDDGTVWVIDGVKGLDGLNRKWVQLPDIPQDKTTEATE